MARHSGYRCFIARVFPQFLLNAEKVVSLYFADAIIKVFLSSNYLWRVRNIDATFFTVHKIYNLYCVPYLNIKCRYLSEFVTKEFQAFFSLSLLQKYLYCCKIFKTHFCFKTVFYNPKKNVKYSSNGLIIRFQQF